MQIGDKMPVFKSKDQMGHVFLSDDLLGGPAVIYFYPKDNTPGCTREACDFRDHIEDFDQIDAVVIGISPDSPSSHEKFIEKHDLNFTLLSDESLEVCRKFGVINDQSLVRTTFIVDATGTIRWIESPVKVEDHVKRVKEALQEITS